MTKLTSDWRAAFGGSFKVFFAQFGVTSQAMKICWYLCWYNAKIAQQNLIYINYLRYKFESSWRTIFILSQNPHLFATIHSLPVAL